MEVEEQTQTDETTKPEEQEVEKQLCTDISTVSLDESEREGSDLRKDERDDSTHMPCAVWEDMEIDDSPSNSPMHVDRAVHIEDFPGESTPHGTAQPSAVGIEDAVPDVPAADVEDSVDVQRFYGTVGTSHKADGKRKPRVSAPAKLESGSNGGDPGGDIEVTPQKT